MEQKAKAAARVLVCAFAGWLALGGCGAPSAACPLVSQQDCCHHPKQASLKDCPYFVALKVAAPDAAPPAIANILALPQGAIARDLIVPHSSVPDQHDLYLSNRVLRI